MSVSSMTGYGRGTASKDGMEVTVELTSVNHRQLDLRLNLPRSMQALQTRMREVVVATVARGHVTVDFTLNVPTAVRRASIRVDTDLAAAYVSALRAVARELDLSEDLSAGHLLDLPDVVSVVPPSLDEELVWRLTKRALTAALRALQVMRRTEGATLGQDVRERLEIMSRALVRIEERVPAAREAYRESLRRRVADAAGLLNDDPDRLAREVVYYAERSDITEEIVRLKSHHSQARGLLRSREPAGRPLDFLAQEMFREINTIGSKSTDGLVAAEVVLIKTELERLREQVRNLE